MNKMILRSSWAIITMTVTIIFSAASTAAITTLIATSTKSISTSQSQFDRREVVFKGQEIPKIDKMSNDTTNFTWGLAGVDNVENLKFA